VTVRERREKIQSKNHKKHVRSQYVYGNAVRKTAPARTGRSKNIRPVEGGNIKRNTEKKGAINAGYILFLTAMLCLAGYFCVSYLSITSSITNDLKEIARLEAQLNSLKAENDDYENRITGAVDLEEIKKKAMNDLGMQYAEDDQIVPYQSDDTDYVRQYIFLE